MLVGHLIYVLAPFALLSNGVGVEAATGFMTSDECEDSGYVPRDWKSDSFVERKEEKDTGKYLGPTPTQITLLFTLTLTNSLTLFALTVLLLRNTYTLASNTTTIENWEIDRHDILVRRARSQNGYLDGPDGKKIRIQRQEFPYDIGVWRNLKQAMGTRVWGWLWPFCSTLSNCSGLEFETNGFEDPNTTWPPPDPDGMPRCQYSLADHDEDPFTASDIDVSAFRERQRKDYRRYANDGDGDAGMMHRTPFERSSESSSDVSGDGEEDEEEVEKAGKDGGDGEKRDKSNNWRNVDGDRLHDFGVDEEVEVDEDDIPLSQLLRRKRDKDV
ncbi:MAG: hypothetical protein Q9221_007681 [Calogaya cf. arnoldii]